MDLSIIKVKGPSMNPFLIDNDLLICQKSIQLPTIGICMLHNNNVHRLVLKNTVKGDRLIYNDLPITDQTYQIILGRVIQNKESKIIFTNYMHPILIRISKIIAFLSRTNTHLNYFRYLNLALIILFASVHRFLEPYFAVERSKR